ncbi:peptidoglycan-binding protein [Clostridium swellfunianum]|uniref:peptidoglycan-binding domain-containing protein n=1 Tax=Clostridium swellfunianum TaxID=1367462 RepID=UPI00202E4419|nr:peptidoglycan-binding domain-containing protein [Clostridium swellfunianum]MCM0649930.1 peptidoglycan-binding protein [Clostridium swellfunianum]
MPKILVYNHVTGRMETYYRGFLEPMPYVVGRTLTVGEFRAYSKSNLLWTDRRMMQAWNTFRRGWGRSIFVGYAFKRIWEGGHSGQSQHYAGLAMDLGQTLSAAQRYALRRYAVNSGLWTYVEPASLTPRWVHVDKRFGAPACASGGYPLLSVGSKGVYVCILQDALNTLGFTSSSIDGVFGYGTRRAVLNFQRQWGLPQTGRADCGTWIRLTNQTVGIGRTPTTRLY